MTGTGTAASAGLALLVLCCAFVAVAAPRESLHLRTRAVQRMFGAQPALATSVTAQVAYTDLDPTATPVLWDTIERLRSDIRGSLAADGIPLAARARDWAGLATALIQVTGHLAKAVASVGPPQMELVYRDALSGNARLLAGKLPVTDSVSARAGRAGAARRRMLLQVAVTRATATRFGLRVGSRLGFGASAALVVTGIVQPSGRSSAFWTADPSAAAPSLVYASTDSTPNWQGAAFIGPGELPGLESLVPAAALNVSMAFPLALGQVTADGAAALAAGLSRAGGATIPAIQGGPVGAGATSGLLGPLSSFVAADAAARNVLALLYVSLTTLGAVVLLLGARLVAEHRRGELALFSARGAALWQIAGLVLRGGALVALPAGAAATLIAVAMTPGAAEPLAWWLDGLTVLVALAAPSLIAVRQFAMAGRRVGTRIPDGAATRAARARRLVAEATLVAAATAALVVLRQQAAPAAGGIDFYTSAAPVLVAIPAAVLILRLCPVTLRLLARLASRRRGISAFVGLARGARTAPIALLPAFALVLALSVVAFGAMIRDAVQRADIAASWQSTGADAVIGSPTSSQPLTSQAQHAIASVRGVTATAPVVQAPGTAAGGVVFTAAIVDPVKMAAVAAHSPGPPFPALALARPSAGKSGPVPVLASQAAAVLVPSGANPVSIGLLNVTIRVTRVIGNSPAVPQGGAFVVVPQWAAGSRQLLPTMMLVAGSRLDKAALKSAVRRTAPGVPVTFRSEVLAGLVNAPLPRAGFVAFAQGAAAAAGFSMLVLLVTLLLGARTRELTLARLSTMGLSRAQGRRLAMIEVLPPVVAAVVGGIGCAWAMVPLVAPAINLPALTGSGLSVPVRADVRTLAATAAGLVILALLTQAAQAMTARRRGVRGSLRIGE